MLTLVLGGAASGKSAYAESLVLKTGLPRYYLATMQVWDAECAARVEKHRKMRAQKQFETLECPLHLDRLALPGRGTVLLEDLGNLVANELYSPGGAGKHTAEAVLAGLERLAAGCDELIAVSNEVFSGGADYAGDTDQYLLALAQALERLALLWPDGKLTLPRVEQAVNDAAHFTPYHWVDALLAGKSKRVLHVLQQLRLEGCEPAILLRTLQRELLLLVTLKRQATHTPLRSLFDKHRVWQNRRQLLSDALTRLSGEQLRQAVTLLTRAELTFKQDYGHDVWPELESLSLLLCHKALADVFIDG